MTTQDRVLELIKKQPDLTRHQIASQLRMSLVEIAEAIRNLEKQELIERHETWS